LLEESNYVISHESSFGNFSEHVILVAKEKLAEISDREDTKYKKFIRHIASGESEFPDSVKIIFDQLHTKEIERYERYQKEMKKKIEDFEDILTEYYYRSDHIGTSWEKAKKQLQKRSAYKRLGDDELAKSTFDAYMAKLVKKMDQCVKSRKLSQDLDKSKYVMISKAYTLAKIVLFL